MLGSNSRLYAYILLLCWITTSCSAYFGNKVHQHASEVITVFDYEIEKSVSCGCYVRFSTNTTAVAMSIIEHNNGSVTCRFSGNDISCVSKTAQVNSNTFLRKNPCDTITTTTTSTTTATPTTTTPTTTLAATTPTTTTASSTTTTATTSTTTLTTTTTTTPTTTYPPVTSLLKYYLSKTRYAPNDDKGAACQDTCGKPAKLLDDNEMDIVKDSFLNKGFLLTISDSAPYKWYDGTDFPDVNGDFVKLHDLDGENACSRLKGDMSEIEVKKCSDMNREIPALCEDPNTGFMFPSSTIIMEKKDVVSACGIDGGTPYKLSTEAEFLNLEKWYKKSDYTFWVGVKRSGGNLVWMNDDSSFPGGAPKEGSSSGTPCFTMKDDGKKIKMQDCSDFSDDEKKSMLCEPDTTNTVCPT